MSDLAKPGQPINVTGLFQSLIGRAERQSALEQRRIFALERGESMPVDIDEDYEDVADLYPESAFDENGNVRFLQAAKEHKVVFDSKHSNPGLGYPSCCRSLCRQVKAYRDPNGYYAYIGVLPDASFGQVKKAIRKLYQKYHPDGWAPNVAEFDYLREIAHVLTDPKRRLRYDNLDPGEKWLDSRVKEELDIDDDGDPINLDDYIRSANDESAWSTMRRTEGEKPDPETIRPDGEKALPKSDSDAKAERAEAMHTASAGNGFDYFAEPWTAADYPRSQLWYHYLVRMAPLAGYTRRIKVWLYDDPAPYWSDIGSIIKIPRFWRPCDATAFALMMVVIGKSDADVGGMG